MPAKSCRFIAWLSAALCELQRCHCAQVPNLAYEIVMRQRGMPDNQRLSPINLQGFLVGERKAVSPLAHAWLRGCKW